MRQRADILIEDAQTRDFCDRLGYAPLEVFTDLWHAHLPVLQLLNAI